jgi:hypothetical protein
MLIKNARKTIPGLKGNRRRWFQGVSSLKRSGMLSGENNVKVRM